MWQTTQAGLALLIEPLGPRGDHLARGVQPRGDLVIRRPSAAYSTIRPARRLGTVTRAGVRGLPGSVAVRRYGT
jgi:hypothetical protein